MTIDPRVNDIVERACAGQLPSEDELAHLLSFPETTPEAQIMLARACELARQASGNRAYIHAQIGIDSLPCPENCRFCSFAAVNSENRHDAFQLSAETVADYTQLFAEEGVHLVSLMATAALPFSTLVELTAAAHEVLCDTHVTLLVNGPDLSLAQAQELKAAGAQAAYHALRLGEGSITGIAPEQRRATIAHIHAAGLLLMTGVEPVRASTTPAELAAAVAETRGFNATWIGACRLKNAAGTAMEHVPSASPERTQQVGAALRLAVGTSVPVGGAGGVAWVDAGADPRSRGYDDAAPALRRKIAAARTGLRELGWDVP